MNNRGSWRASEHRKPRIPLVRVENSHPNWPAEVDVVRARIAALAEGSGEGHRVQERLRYSGGEARELVAVEFLTSSTRVWKNWCESRRLRSYSQSLINAYLEDLQESQPSPHGVPDTLGPATVILQAVERGQTVILQPRTDEHPPVVVRTAAVDVGSGALAVADERETDELTEVDLRQFAGAEVLDW